MDKLDEYSKRLDAHMRDLKERGEFTEVHRNLIEEIKSRQDQMEKKVAVAEANGVTWDVIKSEVERDYDSIFDDLLQITERLDANEMKSK